MAHSEWSPSAGPREYNCPASFLHNRNRPRNDTVHNTYGTAGHHIAELCLRHNTDVDIYAGCTAGVFEGKVRFLHEKAQPIEGEFVHEVDDAMVVALQQYVDRCRATPGDHFIEVSVEHTKWCPDFDEWGDPTPPQFGTSDHIACSPGVMYVDDLKMGMGLKVYAFENIQALKYALGALDEYDWLYDIQEIHIRICQPRLDHFDEWVLSREELLEWGAKIKARAELCYADEPIYGPDEKTCTFCVIRGTCRALQQVHAEKRAYMLDDFDDPENPALLTDAELVEAWKLWPLMQKAHQALDYEVKRRFAENNPVEGLRIVEGTTHRRVTDEEAITAYLLEQGVPKDKFMQTKTTFASPAQIEKLVAAKERKKLADWFAKPKGGPVIALQDDKRSDYNNALDLGLFDTEGDGFDDETD